MNPPDPLKTDVAAIPIGPERALSSAPGSNKKWPAQMICFLGFIGLLLSIFSVHLCSLFVYAINSPLHSYVVLVPFVSAWLIYFQHHRLPIDYSPAPGWAAIPLLIALGIVAAIWFQGSAVLSLSHNDYLSLCTISSVCFLWAGAFLFLGTKWVAAVAFPLAFLALFAPLPDQVVDWLETGSKLASAGAANLFFNMTGTPALRSGTVFELPGITIEIAQECSGIRSSWILFITSLLTAHLFLQKSWARAVLVLAVIPLAILRNGFRILVIALLCVHVGPDMIDSTLHRRGGPIFFLLSLIPLGLLLWFLRRREFIATSPFPMGSEEKAGTQNANNDSTSTR